MKGEISGYTPKFDKVTEETDSIAADVYGVVWRMEQREEGICKASKATFAKILGISEKTVERRLKILVEKEWITDHTPRRRELPHEYNTKRKMIIKTIAEEEKTESRTEKDRESVKDTIYILETAFSELSKIPPPEWAGEASYRQKRWRTPLKEFLRLCDKDIDKAKYLMSEAIAYHRRKKLNINSPASIKSVFIDLLSQGNVSQGDKLKAEGYE